MIIVSKVRAGEDLRADLGSVPGAGQNASPSHVVDSTLAYVLEKINDKTIKVSFRGEEGAITGKPAFRLKTLLVQKRMHVLELGQDLAALRGSAIVRSPLEVADCSEEESAKISVSQPDAATWADVKLCHERRLRLEEELQEADAEEREKLDWQLQQINAYISKVLRPESTAMRKAKQRFDRGLRSLKYQLRGEMPRFARHLDAAIDYEPRTGHYTYVPEEEIFWSLRRF